MPSQSAIILKKPEKKDDKFVAKTIEPIKILFTDVKLKSIRRLVDSKGYTITLYIPETINNEGICYMNRLDDTIMKEIVRSSLKWFNKEITQDELIEMYHKSFCSQTKTLSVIFTNTKYPKLVYNNKDVETVDKVIAILRDNNHFKKCIINVEIEYHGIYFYADNTKNKWVVSSIDITDISNDNNNEWINKDDIVDKLSDNIASVNTKMNSRIIEMQRYINELEENRVNINKLFLELKGSSCNNIQEPLNKINQLIGCQESKINKYNLL
uniref:Uncharacterized protein n=1 Tax=viral metagenome TaxID=1070528 RepID=A0A6C0LDY3_9ZZZZ